MIIVSATLCAFARNLSYSPGSRSCAKAQRSQRLRSVAETMIRDELGDGHRDTWPRRCGRQGEQAPTAISIAKLPYTTANPHRRDPRANTAEASGPRAAGPELILQIGVSWYASNVAFSPDGRLLASMDFMAGSIKLWEVSTPESRATFSLL